MSKELIEKLARDAWAKGPPSGVEVPAWDDVAADVREAGIAFTRNVIRALKEHGMTFDEAWAKKEAAGYRYGRYALENVEFGYRIALDELTALISESDNAG